MVPHEEKPNVIKTLVNQTTKRLPHKGVPCGGQPIGCGGVPCGGYLMARVIHPKTSQKKIFKYSLCLLGEALPPPLL